MEQGERGQEMGLGHSLLGTPKPMPMTPDGAGQGFRGGF